MRKSLIVLAIFGTMSAPVVAQNNAAPDSAQASAKPQMVKKRICTMTEEDSYSRLGGRKICKTVEVPVKPTAGSTAEQTPAQTNTGGK
ncbi:MAG TPA: hypothetical protein VF079_06110 [Sphingomicrobium sp.]